jgi:peroxiredoxin
MQATETIHDEASRLYHPPRRKKLVAMSGIVLIISLPIALLTFLRSEFLPSPLPIGQPVPRLELISLNDQTPIQLGADKQVVLIFIVECPHCQNELFNFEVLCWRYGKRVKFFAISLSDKKKTTEYVQTKAFSFPIALDEEKKAKAVYRVATVPVLFFIDEDGILYTKRSGEASLEVDERLVLAFLNETTDVSSP